MIVITLDLGVFCMSNYITFVHQFLVLCTKGFLLGRKLSYALFIIMNGFQQAFSCLLIAEKFCSKQLWLTNTGFSPNQMKSFLNDGVAFNHTSNLALQQTISHLTCQRYLPHVNVFLIQSVIQFDALQLVSPNTPLFQKFITLADTTDASLEIMELLLPNLPIPIICAFALVSCIHQFLQFFF